LPQSSRKQRACTDLELLQLLLQHGSTSRVLSPQVRNSLLLRGNLLLQFCHAAFMLLLLLLQLLAQPLQHAHRGRSAQVTA